MNLMDKLSSILDDFATQAKNEPKTESIRKLLTKAEEINILFPNTIKSNNDLHILSFKEFLTIFENLQEPSHLHADDASSRLFSSAIEILYVLHCASTYYEAVSNETAKQNLEEKTEPSLFDTKTGKHSKNHPLPPKDIISLQTVKNIEILVSEVLYSIYFATLDEKAGFYLKIRPVEENFIRKATKKYDSCCRHKVLLFILQHLLPLFKHQYIGVQLQKRFFTEIFCGLLQLSFSPEKNLLHLHFSREELNYFIENRSFLFLKSVLLLKGILTHEGGKSYIQTACQSLYLRRFLLNSNDGLSSIIEVSLSLGPPSDVKRKEAIASLIALTKVPDENMFFQILGPQILHLMDKEAKNIDVFHILSLILCQLSKRNFTLTQTYIFEKLLNPLKVLTQETIDIDPCDELMPVVTTLHKIYLDILPVDEELLPYLEEVLSPIFEISALPPTCHVKSKARDLVEKYFNNLSKEEFISALLTLLSHQTHERIPPLNPNVKLTAKIDSICVQNYSQGDDWNEIDERKINLLIYLFERLKHSEYIIDFFERLITFIDFTVLNNIESKHALLTEADINEIKFNRIRKLTFIVGIISSAGESDNLTSKIFRDLNTALHIIKVLLDTHYQECLDVELSRIKECCVTSCVMLLLGFITTSHQSGKISHENWNSLKNIIVPSLKDIENKSTNAALTLFVKQLLNTIITYGTISPVIEDEGSAKNVHSDRTKNLKSHSSTTSSNKCEPTRGKNTSEGLSYTNSSDNIDVPVSCSFHEALIDMCSPHIPVRGHALISLNKLLKADDKETVANVDKVISLFEHHLKDDDTYIYLAAIRGCSTLASKYPDKIIDLLTNEFTSGKQTTETRLKVIEILTETARQLGELLPKYKNMFLNCVLNGVKDEDSLIRASCLSNLGELCKLLRFSIESVLYEIFSLVECVIRNEKSPEVRRAAVLLITLLLQGLGRHSLKVLQSLMLDIYRSLKHIILMNEDPILVTHAQLALEEINCATREFLLPKMNLSKKIYITELPPDIYEG